MDPHGSQTRAPLTSVEALAKMLDHTLLRPELTEQQVGAGCELAKRYQVASVTVRPCDVDVAVRILDGSGVAVGSVSGFPHGDQNTGTKLYETRDLLRRGAKEIDAVVNTSKLLSRQFQYVEMELLQMAEACHKAGAILKVILESALLTDEAKIVACRICARTEADFVVDATGFGPASDVEANLKLLRANLPDEIAVKSAASELDRALDAHQLGCARLATSATAAILDAWKVRLAQVPVS